MSRYGQAAIRAVLKTGQLRNLRFWLRIEVDIKSLVRDPARLDALQERCP